MEETYKVEILTADNITHIENIKALNELEALDIGYQIYNDIIDIKVVK